MKQGKNQISNKE